MYNEALQQEAIAEDAQRAEAEATAQASEAWSPYILPPTPPRGDMWGDDQDGEWSCSGSHWRRRSWGSHGDMDF
eukprot:11705168-Alexandrium_andersonii.AAC.1